MKWQSLDVLVKQPLLLLYWFPDVDQSKTAGQMWQREVVNKGNWKKNGGIQISQAENWFKSINQIQQHSNLFSP